LKVIPVIDVLNGIVVHAVKGKRHEYQPLQSILSQSVKPTEVAQVFKTIGFRELYIADLDAITKGQINFQLLKGICDETKLKVMVDAGVTNLETAKKLIEIGISKVVIGTETLRTKDFVSEAVKILGNDQAIVSLDLKDDKVLVKRGFAGCVNPACLLHEFKDRGVSNIIILDLNRVGSEEGVNVDLVSKAFEEGLNVYVGGGVRDINDLIRLRDLGISGVLVATVLHSGKISIEELRQNELL
jgi:phosphoribosylformimino-5-aminoimidazole carboxamide ribotide isomerase